MHLTVIHTPGSPISRRFYHCHVLYNLQLIRGTPQILFTVRLNTSKDCPM